MSYSVQNIRNVCLLGHGGSGKTALAESLLYMTKAIDRMGKATDGNTVCDYDPEEIKRQISISLAVAPIEFKGCKINVLDTPGGFDFAGEAMEALRAADAAIIVCSAKDGISVGLEKAWKYCEERNMPRFIYISKTDEDNSDYNATFEALRAKYGNKIAPVVVPIWDENKKVTGIIDVLNSMEKLNKMLNVEPLGWNRLGATDLLEAGHQLGKAELLFEKIEDSVIEAQVQKLLDTKKANED